MVSITLSVTKDVYDMMKKHQEINWSGFTRECIIQKINEISWREQMQRKLTDEKWINDWAVKLISTGRTSRINQLREKGLIQ